MTKEDFEKIKKITNEFFNFIDPFVKITFLPPKQETIFLKVESKEPQILIGENGKSLFSIQHLLKAILKRKIKDHFFIDVDINNYKQNKIKYLKELAKNLADKVSLTKKEEILPPMPPYERRIIHLELAERGDVTTQSVGREPKRRVVIKPYP